MRSHSRELVLDRYRPLRPLGSGGSGSVWLARDEQTGLEVALKIVPREGKAADRAEREAEAASRLRHERCLRAYGFGSDSGHVYIAYEYVSGRTLRDAMRSGELRDGQAVEAAAQILDGLAHAHSRGIIHRDVKPSNVLLADDEGISVRLLDFGLAQFDEAETLTAVGDVPGTLAYISPERLRGEEACAASDVWGVGILLWEALAGKHPFWGVPLSKMAATIEVGAPPLELERPDVPKRLLAAIAHALAHDPARRPPAAALARELRAALTGAGTFDEDRKCCFNTNSRASGRSGRRDGARRRRRCGDAAVLPLGRCAGDRSRRRTHCVLGASGRSRARARGADLPARKRLARPGSRLRRSRARVARALLARRALRARVPRRAAARTDRAARARPGRGHAEPRRRATCCAGARRGHGGRRRRRPARLGSPVPAGRGATPRPLGHRQPRHSRHRAGRGGPGGLALEALALAAIAVALPYARTPWRIAGLGAGALAALLLAAPAAPALPLVAAVWLTCAGLVLKSEH